MRMEMGLLNASELERVLQDALKVWREVPFRVQGTEEFTDLLADFGCRVDGEHVRFPQAVVDSVLARISQEKRRWVDSGKATSDVWPDPELTVYTHGQALHICDAETNCLRPATEADLVSWCHLVDAMGIQKRTHPTFIPTDVPRLCADFHTFATIILNSREPHRVSVYSARMLPLFVEACRVAFDDFDAIRQHPVFAAKCWVNSPFMITRENIEVAMDARRLLGQPITFGLMPVAGAAAPVSVAGALVQNTAESLGLIAMRLAIDNLTQGIVGTAAMIDMREGCQRQGGPDVMLHHLAASEMHAHLFGGRASTSIANVAAQTVSAQSMYEKAQCAAFNIAAGNRQLGIGCLAGSDVGSPVQLVLDREMTDYFRHLLRDVSTDEVHVGLSAILETAPKGARYLESEHTARLFREECWLPHFADHRPPLAWRQNPSDMVDRAREEALGLMAGSENQCPLTATEQAQIRELIREAHAMVAPA